MKKIVFTFHVLREGGDTEIHFFSCLNFSCFSFDIIMLKKYIKKRERERKPFRTFPPGRRSFVSIFVFVFCLFIFYFLELAFSFINSFSEFTMAVLLVTPKSKLIAPLGQWYISCQRTLLINYGNKFGNEDCRG